MMATCPICGTKFKKKTYRHLYCCRKCFKSAYRKKMRELQKDKNPLFRCPNCGKTIKLDFSPIKNKKKWDKFSCSCGYRPHKIKNY